MRRVIVSVLAVGLAASFLAAPSAPAAPREYKVIEVKNGGSIRGFVKLSAAYDAPPVSVFKDNEKGCGDKEHASERVKIDKTTLGLGNTVVYLKSIDAGKDWPEEMKKDDRMAIIDQKGCQYVPHLQVVRYETQIGIWNDDRADHNIHGYKGSMKDTQFNFASEPGTKKEDIQQAFLEQPSIYIVKCDIHPWMNAYVHVVDHPYIVTTSASDKDNCKAGEYVLENVPAGDYEIVLWHEGMVETPTITDNKINAYTYSPDIVKNEKVTVEAGKEAKVKDVVFDAPAK